MLTDNNTAVNNPKAIPVVDFNKCETKGMCTHVCTQNVFKIQQLSTEQFRCLSFLGKLKAIFNDNRKAYAANPEFCLNCGKCVAACPEQAIKLLPVN